MSRFKKFEEVEEKESLFRDENIFGVDHVPANLSEIKCRDQEIDSVVKQTVKLIKKRVRMELYISGTTGIGKTYVVKGVLEEAKREYKNLKSAWVNCKKLYPLTPYQFYSQIYEQLGRTRISGLSANEMRKKFLSLIEEVPFVLVIDEVDILTSENPRENQAGLLYDLIQDQVSLILISNVFDWVGDTGDMRLASRMKSNRLDFEDYSRDEMFRVLNFVIGKGLKNGVITNDILREISYLTVERLMCDVRKGKNLIYASVQEAMKEDAKTVTSAHMEKARENVRGITLTQILGNFTEMERLALAGYVSLRRSPHEREQPATTSKMHKFFLQNCRRHNVKPVDETQMKNYLSRLEGSKIIYHEVKSYETRGRTNVHFSDYNVKDLDIALLKNGVISGSGVTDLGVKLGGKETAEDILKMRYGEQ
ncbi:AAA family ATPase [Candidatus Bathyarchaeota archaeon]|nr:MAG: AAA family ATPase [Candidatus Bathyarchaeota archaeon]